MEEEPFGPFHIPQQSRRDKLRINPPNDDRSLPPPPPPSLTYLTTHRSDLLNLTPAMDPHNVSPSSSSSHFPRFNSLSSPFNDSYGSATDIMITSGSVKKSELSRLTNSSPHDEMAAYGGLNLSLATSNRGRLSDPLSAQKCKSAMPTPVGPFTGYASILSRSRFLDPAQELLEDFCGAYRGMIDNLGENAPILEDSAPWCDNNFADRCGNSGLLSMLYEVYRRYRLYCQQMNSAVTSFETVAGLGNAAPFLWLAIKVMSKHFHCLKNAILDQIQLTSKSYSSGENLKGGTGLSPAADPVHHNQKQAQNSSFLQHPVWCSQRGFPDKAVAVLRTWLFENFLHPYPTDSDKQMLAQRTGLSRNQVSNWFTNARVRLWKPMVEEIHTLEKRGQLSSEVENNRGFINILADDLSANHQPSEEDTQLMPIQEAEGDQRKRSRIRFSQVPEQSKEQLDMLPCDTVSSNQLMGVRESQTSRESSNSSAFVDTAVGLSWGQGLQFRLAK
ncbi:hypothetical protein Nepgr_017217 [Nepenthes gracilis]|uniref:Homeobox domain-containing protein n=1 Tax=Nepenthes gracilis TaxID=150966 RepID=A0AAD3XT37_NEPGR|nr:hypothetical protein Nepgr_017217 [Nepenthes gracilis]